MLNFLRYTHALLSAWRSAEKGDWDGVQKWLSKLSFLTGRKTPSLNVPVELNLLYLQSSYFLDDGDDAKICARVVIDQILNNNLGKNSPDSMYIAEFAKNFLNAFADRFLDLSDSFRAMSDEIPESRGSHQGVDLNLIRRFPIHRHVR